MLERYGEDESVGDLHVEQEENAPPIEEESAPKDHGGQKGLGSDETDEDTPIEDKGDDPLHFLDDFETPPPGEFWARHLRFGMSPRALQLEKRNRRKLEEEQGGVRKIFRAADVEKRTNNAENDSSPEYQLTLLSHRTQNDNANQCNENYEKSI